MRTAALKGVARRLLRAAGWALAVAAVGYFVVLVRRHGLAVPGRSHWEIAAFVSAAAVAYGLAVVLLAWIWAGLAVPAGSKAYVRPSLAAGYLKSQFAKYLPGNVFQYAARHVLGRQVGVPHATLAQAAALEMLLLASSAAFLTLWLGMPVLRTLVPTFPDIPRAASLLILAVIPALAWLPLPSRFGTWRRHTAAQVAAAFAGYTGFFLLFGGLYAAALWWCDAGRADFTHVIAGSSLAWLLGFVVPGAPAGAGLREAALAVAAGSGAATPQLLAAIVLFRLTTLGGDLLAFLAGWVMLRRQPPAAHQPPGPI